MNLVIQVPDIGIVTSTNGVKSISSLRDQKIKKDNALATLSTGSGIKYLDDLYVLNTPYQYMLDFAPTGTEPNGTEVTLMDKRDNELYRCRKMNDGRWWMIDNLRFMTAGSFAPDNDEENVKVYGRLYEWQSGIDNAPNRWYIPTDEEWKILEMAYGMTKEQADGVGFRGTDQGTQFKPGGSSGLELTLPGSLEGFFTKLGNYWTSSIDAPDRWNRVIFHDLGIISRGLTSPTYLSSVRCILDLPKIVIDTLVYALLLLTRGVGVASLDNIDISWGDGSSTLGAPSESVIEYEHEYPNVRRQYKIQIYDKSDSIIQIQNVFPNWESLDITRCPSLLSLFIIFALNHIFEIDVTKNTKLTYLGLDFYDRPIIDISKNTLLEILQISLDPVLDNLDISMNLKLREVDLARSLLVTNQTNLVSFANALPVRPIDSKGSLRILNDVSEAWIRDICTAKNWEVS